ncbi:hypothetical protein MTO96_003915 [Rhipicephalus appendiculatus]
MQEPFSAYFHQSSRRGLRGSRYSSCTGSRYRSCIPPPREDHSHCSHRNSTARDQTRDRRASVASLNDPSGPRLIAFFMAPRTREAAAHSAPSPRKRTSSLRPTAAVVVARHLVCHRGSTAAWTMLGEHGRRNRLDDLPRLPDRISLDVFSPLLRPAFNSFVLLSETSVRERTKDVMTEREIQDSETHRTKL